MTADLSKYIEAKMNNKNCGLVPSGGREKTFFIWRRAGASMTPNALIATAAMLGTCSRAAAFIGVGGRARVFTSSRIARQCECAQV